MKGAGGLWGLPPRGCVPSSDCPGGSCRGGHGTRVISTAWYTDRSSVPGK